MADNQKCECECCHVPDYGACSTFERGMNGRCVYCDHAEACHPGNGPYHNGPLGPVPRPGHKTHFDNVMEALDQLYRLHCEARRNGAEIDSLLTAVDELVAAYDVWLG